MVYLIREKYYMLKSGHLPLYSGKLTNFVLIWTIIRKSFNFLVKFTKLSNFMTIWNIIRKSFEI